jgi:hypothetical protein
MARINTGSDAGGGGDDDSGGGSGGGERYRNREDPSDTRDSARGGGGQEDDGDEPLFGGGGDDGGDDDSGGGGGGGERYRNREDPSDTRDSARGGSSSPEEGGSETSSPGGEAPDDAFRDPSTGEETGGGDRPRPNDPENDVGQDSDTEPERRNKRDGIEENQTDYSQGVVAAAYELKDKIEDRYGITDPRNYDIVERGGEVVAEFSEAARGKIRAQQIAEQNDDVSRDDLEVVAGGDVQLTDEARAERTGAAAGGFGGPETDRPTPTALGDDTGQQDSTPQRRSGGFGGGLNAPTITSIFEEDVRGAVANAGGDPTSFDVQVTRDGNQFSAEIVGDVDPLDGLENAESFGQQVPDDLGFASEFVDERLPSSVGEATQTARDTQQGLDAQFDAGLSELTSGARSAVFDARDDVLAGANDLARDPSQALFAVPRAATSAASELDSDDVAAGVTTAAAAGVVAPEPVSTGTGLAVLGGAAVLGIGASAARSEIEIPDPTQQGGGEVEPAEQRQNELSVPAADGSGELDAGDGDVTELEVPTVSGGAGFEDGDPVAQTNAIVDQPATPGENPFSTPDAPSIPDPLEEEQTDQQREQQLPQRGGPAFVGDEVGRVEQAEEPSIVPDAYDFPEVDATGGGATETGAQMGADGFVNVGAGAGATGEFSSFPRLTSAVEPNVRTQPDANADALPDATPTANPTSPATPALDATPAVDAPAFADPFGFSELSEPVNVDETIDPFNYPGPTGSGQQPPSPDRRRPRLDDSELLDDGLFGESPRETDVQTGVQSVGSTLFGDDGRERDRGSELPGVFDR